MTGPEQHAATVRAAEAVDFVGAEQLAADRVNAAEARADELQRERDAAVASAMEYRREREQARREADQLRAALRDAVTLVRVGFLVTVAGERATADFVREPALRELLLTILQAEDTDAALAGVQAEEQTTEEVVRRMNADSGFDGGAP